MKLEKLIPGPPTGTDIRFLERLWLITAVAYEEFDETLMADTDWDAFAKELNERREEWSPYFRHVIPSEDYNVGTTASGIDWHGPLTSLFFHDCEIAKARGWWWKIVQDFTPHG